MADQVAVTDAEEAVNVALHAWFSHVGRCGSCGSAGAAAIVGVRPQTCAEGRELLRAHNDVLHRHLHAEILARGEGLDRCGECEAAAIEGAESAPGAEFGSDRGLNDG